MASAHIRAKGKDHMNTTIKVRATPSASALTAAITTIHDKAAHTGLGAGTGIALAIPELPHTQETTNGIKPGIGAPLANQSEPGTIKISIDSGQPLGQKTPASIQAMGTTTSS